MVLIALSIRKSPELVACGHFNFLLGAFFLDFRETMPDQPRASLAAKRQHSLPDAAIQTCNTKSLMLTIYTTNKDWII